MNENITEQEQIISEREEERARRAYKDGKLIAENNLLREIVSELLKINIRDSEVNFG